MDKKNKAVKAEEKVMEVVETADAESTEVVVVEKESIWAKTKRGVKTTWGKIPKPVKIGMGIVATGAAAFLLGKKVTENSFANSEDIEDDDCEEYDDPELESLEDTEENEAETEEASE